jgi:hypothetical protein
MKFGNMDEIDYMHDINMNNLEQTLTIWMNDINEIHHKNTINHLDEAWLCGKLS